VFIAWMIELRAVEVNGKDLAAVDAQIAAMERDIAIGCPSTTSDATA
jgi:hypothetical protein